MNQDEMKKDEPGKMNWELALEGGTGFPHGSNKSCKIGVSHPPSGGGP